MTVTIVLLGFAVSCGFVELVSRAAARVSGESIWLKDLAMQRKDDQMKRLGRVLRRAGKASGAGDPALDVLFIGSSGMMCSVDPAVIVKKFGITSYNAAIFRGTMSYSAEWSQDFVLRRLSARNLVVEAWLPTINDGSDMIAHGALYRNSPYFGRRRRLHILYEWGHRCAFVRVAPLLASPHYLLATFKAMWRQRKFLSGNRCVTIARTIGEFGESIEHDVSREYRTGPRLHDALLGMVQNFQLGGAEWASLEALVAEASSRGMQIFLLETPCSEDMKQKYFPGGKAGWERQHQLLEEMSSTLDVVWLRPEVLLTSAGDFADPIHANLRGKGLFSTAVGAALATHIRSSLDA